MNKSEVLRVLTKILDPELGINIVDLGLIYDVLIEDESKIVKVIMTLTTPFCPFNSYLIEQIEHKLKEEGFKKIEVELSFDPVWTPERINPTLRKKLGLKKSTTLHKHDSRKRDKK
jgi:metal-sulfur cluster biosynthetic enzyme